MVVIFSAEGAAIANARSKEMIYILTMIDIYIINHNNTTVIKLIHNIHSYYQLEYYIYYGRSLERSLVKRCPKTLQLIGNSNIRSISKHSIDRYLFYYLGHKFNTNQVKDTLERQYSIFQQTKPIFIEL